MNTDLTMFAIGLPVYDTWCRGFCKFARSICFFTYIIKLFDWANCLSVLVKPRDGQLRVVIGFKYTLGPLFFEK